MALFTQQERESILSLIDASHEEDASLEVEARFGSFDDSGRWRPGISRTEFSKMQEVMFRREVTITRSTDRFFTGTDVRFTTIYDDGGSPIQQLAMRKTRVSNIDLTERFTRIGFSTEEYVDEEPPTTEPTLVRSKVRWSMAWDGSPLYIINDAPPRFRLDLTEVTSYFPGDVSRGGTVYELELEVIEPVKQNVVGFERAVTSSLRELLGTILLYTATEKENVINRFNRALGSQKSGSVDTRSFTQARDLKTRDLVYGGIVASNNRETTYAVTIKVDGVRRFLFIDKDGLFLVGASSELMKVLGATATSRLQSWFDTIIEGELVPQENMLPPNPTLLVKFIMNDVLPTVSGQGSRVANDDLTRRLEIIDRLKTTVNGLAYDRDGRMKSPAFLFTTKPYRRFFTAQEFFDSVSLTLDETYPYKTDGLIFTPVNRPYRMQTHGRTLPERKLSSHPDIVKWKPAELLTIDFRIRHLATSVGVSWTEPAVELLSTASSTWSERRINSLDRLYRDQRFPRDSLVPFIGSTRTPFDAATGLLMTDLVRGAPNGSVIEFAWTQQEGQRLPHTNQDVPQGIPGDRAGVITELPDSMGVGAGEGKPRGQLVATRIRHDKLYPNALDVALDVWDGIHQPLTEEVIRGERFGLLFRHHNREKTALFLNIGVEKRRPKVLLDIGSGRGGDVMKWIQAGFTHVVCVEPNEENRLELTRRLDATQLIYIVIPTTGQDLEEIINWTSEFSPVDGKVHAISYMLSLSFFFDTEESVMSIATLVDELLLPNGWFTAFTIDGAAVKEWFSDPLNYISYNGVKKSSFSMIDFEMHPPGDDFPKEHIYINIPGSIVTRQKETLTEIERLLQVLSTVGLQTVLDRFSKPAFMTAEEEVFNTFFRSLILKKSGTGQQITFTKAVELLDTGGVINIAVENETVTIVLQTGARYSFQAVYNPEENSITRVEIPESRVEQLKIRNVIVLPEGQVDLPPDQTRFTIITQGGDQFDVVAARERYVVD